MRRWRPSRGSLGLSVGVWIAWCITGICASEAPVTPADKTGDSSPGAAQHGTTPFQPAEPNPMLVRGESLTSELEAAQGLLKRLLPRQAKSFILELIPSDHGQDVFEIGSREGKVVLRGNNGVAIASALNWYLKYYCHCQISLKTRQLNLPERLPTVQPTVRRVSRDRYRYFLNYCCFGYSLPWYDWAQWERLIDWMALNGINAPLAVTGQEAVWAAAGRRLGFTEADLKPFLAGPPYLPFDWMGCLDGWGGPLPKSWIQRHAELQQRILKRERALGMTPVLQGFTGHVPPATKRRFPDAHLHSVHWIEWDTLLLDPLDPLFARFASTFLNEQRRLFGTDHLYAADTFIEMTPPSGDTNFLAATGRAIYQGLAKTDPQAVWALQGWTFFNQAQFWTQPRIEAFLGAVPDDHMLVLDLFCDVTPVWNKTRGFCGKPWVWCALQNFGDCVYLGGALNRVSRDLPAARSDPLAKRLSGIGFVNEGLDYNPVVFDFLFEQAWRVELVNLDEWIRNYSLRANGVANTNCEAAWAILKDTAFTGQHEVIPAFMLPPSLHPPGKLPYSNQRLAQAWEQLLRAAPAAEKSDTYRYDLVSVTRQVVGNYSAELQRKIIEAYRTRNRPALQAAARGMSELIRDLDELLASRPEYMLGRWLEEARRWGATAEERNRLEWNARRVITMWGAGPQIRDYSRRQWSGMLTGFYLQRWERFVQALDSALATGGEFEEKKFDQDLQAWEKGWADQHDRYPTRSRGNAVEISHRLWDKYRDSVAEKSVMQVRQDPSTGQWDVTEAGQPVLRYNYQTNHPGDVLQAVRPDDRKYARPRSDYIHPLYGLEGEVLTKDWSVDHPHHRGIYWAWPEVDYQGERGDLHALQRVFARPTGRCSAQDGPEFARIEAENLWLWEDREPIVNERTLIRVWRSNPEGRFIDLEFYFRALKENVAVARRETKLYGGLNIRLAPVQEQQIRFSTEPPSTPERRDWGDLSGVFAGGKPVTGLAVFQNPANPGYPGDWIQYPEINWFQPTFPPAGTRFVLTKDEPLVLKYRLWLHSGKPSESKLAELWSLYAHSPTQP